MSVTLRSCIAGRSLSNIPSPPKPTSPQLSDVKITTASSTGLAGQVNSNGTVVEFRLEGSFQYPNGLPKTAADLTSVNYTVTKQEIYYNGVLTQEIALSPAANGQTLINADTDATAARAVYSGNDTFIGSTGGDANSDGDGVDGFDGDDIFYGNGSGKYDDIFYGGSGTDTSVYRGKYANYTIYAGNIWNDYTQKVDIPGYVVTDKTGLDGRQQLSGVERLKFTDGTMALDFAKGQNGYKAAMMIGAAFGKEKINDFFAPAVRLFDQGMSSNDLAKLVVDLKLIDNAIGSSANKAFVNAIYKNVVGVLPDALSEAIYTNYLDSGALTKAQLLALAAGVESLENQINLTGLQSTGIFFAGFI